MNDLPIAQSQQDRIAKAAITVARQGSTRIPEHLILGCAAIQVGQQFAESRSVALAAIRKLVNDYVDAAEAGQGA